MPLSPPLYVRHHEEVLGEEMDGEDGSAGGHRCFNCGSPDHVLSACPEPVDRALVSLPRQIFNFYRGESGGPFQRVHEVEQWRKQRLEWLDEFDPGQIKGSLLRDALGLRDGDPGERVEWLRNMACWGYPPGWVGERDPRERVWELITDSHSESDEECEFAIVADDGEEHLTLRWDRATPDARRETVEDESHVESSRSPRRWAVYPDTYFLWSKLPVYKGFSLPAVGSDECPPPPTTVSSTFSTDRQALWESIVSGSLAADSGIHGTAPNPGKQLQQSHGVLSSEPSPPEPNIPPPPPPSSSPPPLPPPSPPTGDPDSHAPSPTIHNQAGELEDDEDMDLSD